MNKKNILVVDDEPINYLLLDAILKRLDYSVLYAKDGYNAIDMVQENDIALIIMDIKMPGMNGIETSRRIKSINPKIKIIASSAVKELDKEEYSLFVDFISKPINRTQLIEMVDKYAK